MAQLVKSLPTMQESQVRSLGWEDTLEEGMAAHSSILAWRILWTEEPSGLQSIGSQRVRHGWSDKHVKWKSQWIVTVAHLVKSQKDSLQQELNQ